jgi:hypothetical protein
LPRLRQREIPKIQRAAAVRQPAHDHLVARNHLLAVDAQVLARARFGNALRASRHDQPPRDQRPHVAGPAGLHRQRAEVDLRPLQDDLLAHRAPHAGGLHVPQRLGHLQQPARVLQPLGRLRLLQARQQGADLAQLADLGRPHAHRHPPRGPEQIRQGGNFVTDGLAEPQRGPAGTQNEVTDRCHFKPRGHWLCDLAQFASLLQALHEFPQVAIFHIN